MHEFMTMTTESWLVTLAIGAFVGWLAGLFLRGSGYGILGNIVVGLLGAVIGQWLFRALNLSLPLGNALIERILIALIGALLLMFVISLLRPRSLRERTTGFFRRARS
jgi:uncharacterized membrane protein YeaQ/YmgE (transglycosylase-associated protein family)